ncbi:tRNA-dihydrouridine(16/17) synthase NAD(P)(+) [Acrasis kona]|uniref:tRNA-dihydrouridine(16/17) synthase [NAD(P)(+)] n=1 Tax=Acrasis kona TaxID=1008807 RepID=A0AAW2YWG9_9EUKA
MSVKLGGYDFYQSIGCPKYAMAPMVEQSELAFRLLCKRYNTQLTYTPMFFSQSFVDDENNRKKYWQSTPDEGPLLVQFCGNDPQVLVQAGKLCLEMPHAKESVVGIDLNLGCPQRFAQKARIGAFLMEEQNLIREIVSTLHRELPVPITCKIRIFKDIQHTIAYAQMIRDAGCQLLAVHGRTREQRGTVQGLADWDAIKIVREHIKDIPVFANGNIRTLKDADDCIEHTGCEGVLSACGLLDTPALFSGVNHDNTKLALEYLELCAAHEPPEHSFMTGHVFKMLKDKVKPYNDLKVLLNTARTRQLMKDVVVELGFREEKEKMYK